MMRASPSALTPTPPGSSRTERRRPWGILWHRSCRAKTQRKSQAGRRNFLSGALCPSPDISACGSRCGSTKNRKNKLAQKVVKAKETPLESADSSGILELLPRFELGTSSLPNPRLLIFPFASCRQVSPQTQCINRLRIFLVLSRRILLVPVRDSFFISVAVLVAVSITAHVRKLARLKVIFQNWHVKNISQSKSSRYGFSSSIK